MSASLLLPALLALASAADTSRAVPLANFLAQVRANHPVARQAALAVRQAESELQAARGAFDPVVRADWERKTFGGTEYFDYATASLTLPTPVGADLYAQFDRTEGTYFNPDRRTPADGLFTLGVKLPLGRKLLTDERRTGTAVARAGLRAAQATATQARNTLGAQATKAYTRWYEATRRAAAVREQTALARARLDWVRQRVLNGEVPPIDTVEARLELDRREAQEFDADRLLLAARVQASAFLWDDQGLAVELPDGAEPDAAGLLPQPADTVDAERLVAVAADVHPELRALEARLEQADAERRYAKQNVLPEVTATAGLFAPQDTDDPGVSDDLKLGAAFESSLFLRGARGKAGAAARKAESLAVQRDRLRRDLGNAARIALNDLLVLARQAILQSDIVARSRLLRDGEQRRFENGESTLFVVNQRDRAVLEEVLRLAALEAQYANARADFAVAVGAGE